MINSFGIHVKVKNHKKSKKFYEALGFEKVFEYGPNKKAKEDYSGTIFEHGKCKLEIADGHRAVKNSVFNEQITSPKISLMIYVDSIEKVIKNCTDNGIKITVKPRHYYWNTLEVVIKGPDGTVLVFIQPYSKEDAAKLSVDETFAKPLA